MFRVINNDKHICRSGISLYEEDGYALAFEKLYQDPYTLQYTAKWLQRSFPPYEIGDGIVRVDPVLIKLVEGLSYVKDSYDLFVGNSDGDQLYSHITSYATKEEEVYKRMQYGIYHNQQPGIALPAIDEQRILNLPCHSHSLSFVISWHRDHENYWHFIYDAAFRLYMLIYLTNIEPSSLSLIVVGNDLALWQKDLLKLILGCDANISYYKRGCWLKRAISVAPSNRSLLDKNLLNSYTKHIGKGLHQNSSDNSVRLISDLKLVYVKRGTCRNGRSITNETQLEHFLESEFRDSVFIDPGSMTIAEQQAIFKSANIVIGAHGSALLNLIYIERGIVIELSSNSYDPIHDYILATQHNIPFIRIVCNSISKSPSADFTCDINKIKKVLTLLGDGM